MKVIAYKNGKKCSVKNVDKINIKAAKDAKDKFYERSQLVAKVIELATKKIDDPENAEKYNAEYENLKKQIAELNDGFNEYVEKKKQEKAEKEKKTEAKKIEASDKKPDLHDRYPKTWREKPKFVSVWFLDNINEQPKKIKNNISWKDFITFAKNKNLVYKSNNNPHSLVSGYYIDNNGNAYFFDDPEYELPREFVHASIIKPNNIVAKKVNADDGGEEEQKAMTISVLERLANQPVVAFHDEANGYAFKTIDGKWHTVDYDLVIDAINGMSAPKKLGDYKQVVKSSQMSKDLAEEFLKEAHEDEALDPGNYKTFDDYLDAIETYMHYDLIDEAENLPEWYDFREDIREYAKEYYNKNKKSKVEAKKYKWKDQLTGKEFELDVKDENQNWNTIEKNSEEFKQWSSGGKVIKRITDNKTEASKKVEAFHDTDIPISKIGLKKVRDKQTKLYGLENESGEWVVWPDYKWIDDVFNGSNMMIRVKNKNGSYGAAEIYFEDQEDEYDSDNKTEAKKVSAENSSDKYKIKEAIKDIYNDNSASSAYMALSNIYKKNGISIFEETLKEMIDSGKWPKNYIDVMKYELQNIKDMELIKKQRAEAFQKVNARYSVRKQGNKWIVWNKEKNKSMGESDTKEKAEAHMRALYANMPKDEKKNAAIDVTSRIEEYNGEKYIIKIKDVSPKLYNESFGRSIDGRKKLQKWLETAKKTTVDEKNVMKWIKENNPSEYYAKWKAKSSYYSAGVVEIYYKDLALDSVAKKTLAKNKIKAEYYKASDFSKGEKISFDNEYYVVLDIKYGDHLEVKNIKTNQKIIINPDNFDIKKSKIEASKIKAQNDNDIEDSILEKIMKMNDLGIRIANRIEEGVYDYKLLDKEEMDILYGVADGLVEDRIMKVINGETSLRNILEMTPEKIEDDVENYIKNLNEIEEKLKQNKKINARVTEYAVREFMKNKRDRLTKDQIKILDSKDMFVSDSDYILTVKSPSLKKSFSIAKKPFRGYEKGDVIEDNSLSVAARKRVFAGLEVANEIFNQLGGNKFVVMTGSKNFSGSENSLSFKIGSGARNGIKYCRITLNGKDLYDIQFKDGNGQIVVEHKDIYNDMLRDIFEKATGMYTSLGRTLRSNKVNAIMSGEEEKAFNVIQDFFENSTIIDSKEWVDVVKKDWGCIDEDSAINNYNDYTEGEKNITTSPQQDLFNDLSDEGYVPLHLAYHGFSFIEYDESQLPKEEAQRLENALKTLEKNHIIMIKTKPTKMKTRTISVLVSAETIKDYKAGDNVAVDMDGKEMKGKVKNVDTSTNKVEVDLENSPANVSVEMPKEEKQPIKKA